MCIKSFKSHIAFSLKPFVYMFNPALPFCFYLRSYFFLCTWGLYPLCFHSSSGSLSLFPTKAVCFPLFFTLLFNLNIFKDNFLSQLSPINLLREVTNSCATATFWKKGVTFHCIWGIWGAWKKGLCLQWSFHSTLHFWVLETTFNSLHCSPSLMS